MVPTTATTTAAETTHLLLDLSIAVRDKMLKAWDSTGVDDVLSVVGIVLGTHDVSDCS